MSVCPNCRAKCEDTADQCMRCGLMLVDPDAEESADDRALEVVLRTGDATLVAAVRSVFESEEIPCVIRGDRVQDLFGLGRLGIGFNFIVGPIQVLVPHAEVEHALAILAQLDRPSGGEEA